MWDSARPAHLRGRDATALPLSIGVPLRRARPGSYCGMYGPPVNALVRAGLPAGPLDQLIGSVTEPIRTTATHRCRVSNELDHARGPCDPVECLEPRPLRGPARTEMRGTGGHMLWLDCETVRRPSPTCLENQQRNSENQEGSARPHVASWILADETHRSVRGDCGLHEYRKGEWQHQEACNASAVRMVAVRRCGDQ